ncbi:hypothetical protein DNI29_22205 [Hymenobacter sediminis]|uniref:hypothetical protein n=1 Tax=Hymenobacter sediminis TaxID=2218621 RepID=UPI000DA6BFA8|nr:hypothetical protein [Hymenobacter sediminis]RPD44113.1 hypothetical protein DNI29_22205 [Hymenobacter sediminis]
MKQILYGLLLASQVVLTGCSEKSGAPTPSAASASAVHIVVSGAKYGTFSTPRLTLSQSPVNQQKAVDVLLTAPVVTSTGSSIGNLNPINTSTWQQAELHSRTLHLSLYFQDIESADFIAPRGADKAQVSVRVNNEPALLLELDSSILQDTAPRWQDAQGKWNAGVNITFTY